MNSFEHLRHVARSGGAPGEIATEAAWALATLAGDPAALVMSCRRLLEAHPSCAPLWWSCAHILASPEPRVAAQKVVDALTADVSVDELEVALPESITLGAPVGRAVLRVLADRPDLRGQLLGTPSELRRASAWLGDGASFEAYAEEEIDEVLEEVATVVIEPVAASPECFLLDERAAAVVRDASRRSLEVIVVLNEGVLLPSELLAALERLTVTVRASYSRRPLLADESPFSRHGWEQSTIVVSPTGATHALAPHRADIGAVPELVGLGTVRR